MSNEHPKPKPNYELLETNENPRLALIRKVTHIDFKLDDVLTFIQEAEADKAKSKAMIEYNDAIIENIKGFHPEVIAFYDGLEAEKQTAFLLFAKAVADREKHAYTLKNYDKEITQYHEEIKEIEETLNLKS